MRITLVEATHILGIRTKLLILFTAEHFNVNLCCYFLPSKCTHRIDYSQIFCIGLCTDHSGQYKAFFFRKIIVLFYNF